MPDLIEFNVGGQHYTTTYETIGFDKKCALYTWYIERKGSAHLTKDCKGRFFIDRDPASFGIILNYLRLQSAKQLWEVCLPKDPDRLALLTQEADYFRVPKLRDQAIALLHKCTIVAADETGGGGTAAAGDADYVNEVSGGRRSPSSAASNGRRWKAANGNGNGGRNGGHMGEGNDDDDGQE